MPLPIQRVKGALALSVLGLGLLICFNLIDRGFWLDEFWTLATTSPDQSWADFWTLMLDEVHPPLYYALIQSAQKIGITDTIALRGLNLLGVPLVLWALWYSLKKNTIEFDQACVVLAMYAASPLFLNTFAEIRAYFLLYSTSIALAVLTLTFMRMRALGLIWDTRALIIWGSILGVFVNLHYFATLMGGLAVLALCVTSRGRGVIRLLIVSAGVTAPALAMLALQARSSGPDIVGWITTGSIEAAQIIVWQSKAAGADNMVVFGIAITMLLFALEKKDGLRTLHDPLVIVSTVAIFFVFLIVVNEIRPIIVGRYLIAGAGFIVVFLMILSTAANAPRWSVYAICGFALMSQVKSGATQIYDREGWAQSAAIVADIVGACPEARVYIDPDLASLPDSMIESARRYGQHYYSTQFGFEVTEISVGYVMPAPGKCPNILWFEHAVEEEFNGGQTFIMDSYTFTGKVSIEEVGLGLVVSNSAR